MLLTIPHYEIVCCSYMAELTTWGGKLFRCILLQYTIRHKQYDYLFIFDESRTYVRASSNFHL